MQSLFLVNGFRHFFKPRQALVTLLILLITPLFFQSHSPAQEPQVEDVLDQGLIAFFPFNGNADDESENAYHGTVNGAILTTDRFGNAESAYHFDGKDDFIKVPVNINPEVLPQVTIVAWARADKKQHITKVFSHDNGSYDRSMGIDNRGGGKGWSAFSGSSYVLGFHPLKLEEWVFIAVVYDQAKETVTLFINGTEYNKKGKLGKGLSYARIGSNPSFGSHFSGDIDDVRIYKRAFTIDELNQLYKRESEVPTVTESVEVPQLPAAKLIDGLIAYYPFTGNADDESKNENHGTVSGAKLTTDRFGNMACAYLFDGKDDFIKVPVNINPDVLPQVTIAAWARAKMIKNVAQVVSHDNSGYDRSIGIDSRGGGNGWSAFCGSGSVLGFHPVKKGEWTFIAAIYDQRNGTVKLFVDGRMYEKKGKLEKGWDYFHIGSNPSFGSFFSGDIDDVCIYKRALTLEELERLYQER